MYLNQIKAYWYRISTSTRMIAIYGIVLVLFLLLLFSLLYQRIKSDYVKDEAIVYSERVWQTSKRIDDFGLDAAKAYCSEALRYNNRDGVVLSYLTPGKDIVYLYPPPIGEAWDYADFQSKLRSIKEEKFQFEIGNGTANHYVVIGQRNPDNSVVALAGKRALLEAKLERFRSHFWMLLLPVMIFGLLAGIRIAIKLMSPMRELVASMKHIEKGSLSTRVPVHGSGDELDEIKVIFNRMLDKVEGLVTGLKEAFDNLAHDIRTPVTRLRGRAEITLNDDNSDLETYREALQSCFENSDKILSFLQTLTDISEAENRIKNLRIEKRYIGDLVNEIMDLYEIAFEEKGIHIHKKLDTNDWAMVDAKLISRVIANLLDNAHKYSPEGSDVTIETINNTENVLIRVTDSGPGITEDEHELIFDKLYRSDKSRTEYGMGLGLTFVRAVILAHDGKVSVKSPVKDGHGTQFEVMLQKMR